MIPQPCLSISVPLKNSELYLESLLNSLQEQTFADFEILLLDQASTDWTSAICREYCRYDPRLRYFYLRKNQRTLSFGIQVALAADYWLWTGTTTLYPLNFLDQCVKTLDEQPEIVWCYAGMPPSGMMRMAARRSLVGNLPPRVLWRMAGVFL
jgi:glycosyltransferase involved in cell wall biosynthesis